MQFETFYQTVNTFGRYQKWKYFFVCLTYMLPPIMVYTWTFTAATPSFRCQLSTNEMLEYAQSKMTSQHYSIPSESQCQQYKSRISLAECQRCYQSVNKSRSVNGFTEPLIPCEHFIFDRTYYQSTLVEEVRLCSFVFLLN